MSAKGDVRCGLGPEHLEAAARVLDDILVARVIEDRHAAIRRVARLEHDPVLPSAILHRGDPGRSALRVTGHMERPQRRPAKGYRVVVLQHACDPYRLPAERAESRVVVPALERLGITPHGHHLGARRALHRRVPFDVIEVRVARQHDFDLGHFEAELLDAPRDPVVHLVHAGVDQNVSLWCGDQIRGDVRRADVVNVADDAERVYWIAVRAAELLIPLARELRGALLLRGRRSERDDQGTCHRKKTHNHLFP